MKLKELESMLSSLSCEFPKPNIALEQYPTSAHLASRMIFVAENTYEDIEDRTVLDLGCGTGMLSMAATFMGASSVVGVDCDAAAIEVARNNSAEEEADIDFVLAIIPDIPILDQHFDTVVMNPPFGTRKAGIDWTFLETAFKMADVVYSLHKSSTRPYLLEKAARDCEFEGEVVAEMKFDLPKSYKFHKKESLDIAVDLLRFERRES